MAGHSQFKNIMHRKRAVDAKRSRAFSKHARLIMTAARLGGPDPATNLSLRYAIDGARADNMTKDAIERAIAKGSGSSSEQALQAVTYEGYGPGSVALLIDSLTDNRNRAFAEIRSCVESHGGNMGESGCVAWNFHRKAVFFVSAPLDQEERLLEIALEAEADECSALEGGFEITADANRFAVVREALAAAGLEPDKGEIAALPLTTLKMTDAGQIVRLVRLIGALDDLDDVQSVATNLDWSPEALSAAEQA